MIITEDICTASKNRSTPIHNWFKFTAGFSYILIDNIIKESKLDEHSLIFDPFAGCGTTLVQAQKKGINSVGNESNGYMYDVIKAKIEWKIDETVINSHIKNITKLIKSKNNDYKPNALLTSLFSKTNLRKLYIIKNYIKKIEEKKYYGFMMLALSQAMHKSSKHPISSPYISRNIINENIEDIFIVFKKKIKSMLMDIVELKNLNGTAKVYKHDSRKINCYIKDGSVDCCITSPPYLNNLDYGEVTKVYTHLFDHTETWNDVTNKIRKKLVTAATTHYKENRLDLDEWKKCDFHKRFVRISNTIINLAEKIKISAKNKNGKKSFDVLVLYYFRDMQLVLEEMYRVQKRNSNAYIVVADSAPYSIYIPTTNILSNIALKIGYRKSKTIKIRDRGLKWQNHLHRHNLILAENLLVLKK